MINNSFKTLVILVLSLSFHFASAHGEDKLGPHGGYIRMPGGFHTEVLKDSKNSIKIYLLDINWKNPSIKDSSVQLTLNDNQKTDNQKSTAQCEQKTDHFVCTFPPTVDLTKKAELKVVAQRENQKGMEVTYELPLKIKPVKNEHSSHH